MADGVLILRANCEQVRNVDVFHPFRQDSHFFYLTGFEEPDSVLIFRPGQQPESILFVRPKDPVREKWDGFRFGPEGACRTFAMDQAYNLNQLPEKLPDLLEGIPHIYHRWGEDTAFDRLLKNTLIQLKKRQGRSGEGFPALLDYWEILGEQRVIKTQTEIADMRKACQVSAQAHIQAMKGIKPGISERQIEAVLEYTLKEKGSKRWGYSPIVASGPNACTLHYQSNNDICRDGDLLLIDAGGEWNHYSADITRTFPVNGSFTDLQKDFYQSILEVQKSLILQAKPGITFDSLQDTAIKRLSQILRDFKLLKGSLEEIIQQKTYKKYYPHFVGHFLGLDVHDVGLYKKNGKPRGLEAGMCFTIEPGLYIPQDDEVAPEGLRGVGIRIEDDILLNNQGCEVLSKEAPKEINEMTEIVGKGFIGKA